MARGGKRPGAGRKPLPSNLIRTPVTIRLPAWLIETIDEMEGSRTELVELAVLKYHKLRPPA